MSEHTPGPWFVDGFVGVKASANRHRGLAICYPQEKDGIAQANARLIASAPMLLETLQFILDHGYVNASDYDRVSKAIEEATGVQP